MKINLPLMALAIGAFGIGVTEFAPMGMLPVIAADLGVSIPAAGLLVSAYAFGVLVGAPIMTLAFAQMGRRRLLVLSMGIFTLGNLLSAFADGYWMLLAGRIVTSFNHGAFFGVGAVVAASVVPDDKRAGAVAAMFSGLTLATIGGVPSPHGSARPSAGARPSSASPLLAPSPCLRSVSRCRRSRWMARPICAPN